MRKILFNILFGLLHMLSWFPLWMLYIFSDILYLIVYRLVGYRVKLVHQHIADSFPEKDEQERCQIEKEFYGWFCDFLVETVKLTNISYSQLRRRMIFKGVDKIIECLDEGQSCAVYLGHYCNWEWITSLALWIPKEKGQCGQIYHVLENKEFNGWLLQNRQRFGAVCIPMAETLRRLAMYRQQKQSVVIGYISDQAPFWNNIHHWLDFLNHDTPVLTGTERLTRKANHAIFYLDVRRVRRGFYEAEIKLITRKPQLTKDFEITDIYFHLLEKRIKKEPQYYLWTHNRWKRTHEEFNMRLDTETGRVSLEPLEELKKKKGLL